MSTVELGASSSSPSPLGNCHPISSTSLKSTCYARLYGPLDRRAGGDGASPSGRKAAAVACGGGGRAAAAGNSAAVAGGGGGKEEEEEDRRSSLYIQ